jgi:hypothetical protein
VATNSGEWSYAYCSGDGGLAGFYVEAGVYGEAGDNGY